MVTLLHGDDNVSSRTAFANLKDKGSVNFDAEGLSLLDFSQTVSGMGLFKDTKKIFIENLFSKKVKSFIEVIDLINESSKSLEFYIWNDSEVSVKQASVVKNLKVENFKLPKNLWTFLDNIRPGNPTSISLFHKVLEEADENVIFSMIVRQFRLLLSVYSNIRAIDEAKRMAPWQRGKLQRQAQSFSEESLLTSYKKLFEIDMKHKTGILDIPLSQKIDFFLLDL